jgi:PPOX class probable F420-dependent enzyme
MIEPEIRALASGPNFAALSTLMPNGQPQVTVMWVDCDHDYILLNTEVHRQKFKNIRRDPRVTVSIWDKDNFYRYAEVRGEVVETVTGIEARAHIDRLSEKYTGGPYNERMIQTERVILKVRPTRQRPPMM